MQSRIAQLRHHEVGYLLPRGGNAITYAHGAPCVDYHIDARSLRQCVHTLMHSDAGLYGRY